MINTCNDNRTLLNVSIKRKCSILFAFFLLEECTFDAHFRKGIFDNHHACPGKTRYSSTTRFAKSKLRARFLYLKPTDYIYTTVE